MLAQFQSRYLTGSLISELLQVHQGKFVVRVEAQIDGVTRATGLAAAENLELAEDRARSRALMVLGIEPNPLARPELSPLQPPLTSEVQPGGKAPLPLAGTDKTQTSDFTMPSEWNSSTNSVSALTLPGEWSTLTPTAPQGLEGKSERLSVAPTPPVQTVEMSGNPVEGMSDFQKQSNEEPLIPASNKDVSVEPDDYSYQESTSWSKQPEPETVLEVRKPVDDLADAVERTSAELKRLGWSNQQGRNHLKTTYGKTARKQLNPQELMEFLKYLESQPTPSQLPLL